MPVTIYHNPDCGTSRNTLALIRHFGIDPLVVEYLRHPPPRAELAALLVKAGLSPQEAARKKGTPFADLGLESVSDAAVLDAMMVHPILINRPLVVSDAGAALCRPSDVVLDLLPVMPGVDAFKEEGAPFLRDSKITATDSGLHAALKDAHLAVDDLGDDLGAPSQRYFVYRSLSGAVLGYGGYELYGRDVFLRSIVVMPEARGKKVGRNLVPLLLYRAYREGAKTAWLLTTTAAAYFEKIGFKESSRETAPAAILATRQARSLCPASAVLLCKAMRL